MRIVAILTVAGLVSWGLRVLLITILPASRLPAGIRDALEHGGAAVPAALVATAIAAGGGGALAVVTPSPEVLALLVSGAVAWRTRQLALTVGVAVAAYWLLGVAARHLAG